MKLPNLFAPNGRGPRLQEPEPTKVYPEFGFLHRAAGIVPADNLFCV